MRIPVFYSREQVALDNVSASPSAKKPMEVVASWKEQGFPIEIMGPAPAKVADFCLAHDPDHVHEVMSCKKPNGFGNKLESIAKTLPWTTGSMLSAARHVLRKKVSVAVSPTSGFHHAGVASSDGFCTFNGLMVTAMALRRDGDVSGRIGILDIDEHYGNGTDEIIEFHNVPGIHHYTFGAPSGDGRLRRGDAEKWLARLPAIVRGFEGCEIVLYQAGADPHTDDPFGRGILSTPQLAERDHIVFAVLKTLGVPVVWNLAGGYVSPLRKVLDIHDNTMRACVKVYTT